MQGPHDQGLHARIKNVPTVLLLVVLFRLFLLPGRSTTGTAVVDVDGRIIYVTSRCMEDGEADRRSNVALLAE